jgi:class 3 adenylate cyclase
MSRVTMLAADIRGFTTLSEKHDPQQIVSLLNDYFTAMEAAINAYGGVIERFVGDAVMAVFYRAGETSGEVQAALAALAMRQKLALLNDERAGRGLFIIENGIGIASGEAASGLVGSESGRMVFTVLGKVTKLAELLESQTKHVDSRVLLCAETARALGERFVVQYSEKVTVCQAYELVGAKPEAEHG